VNCINFVSHFCFFFILALEWLFILSNKQLSAVLMFVLCSLIVTYCFVYIALNGLQVDYIYFCSYDRHVIREFVFVGSHSKRDFGLLYGKDLSVSDKDWC